MDRDHRLAAPDNESLRTIEQLSDRSELTTIYPHSHNEWEGVDLLSREAREEKRDREQQRINLTIRKWFPAIGLLTPMPFVLGSIIVTAAVTFLRIEHLAYLLLPVVITVALWLYLSFRSIKTVFGIFYQHSIKATPFVMTLLSLIILSLQGHYIAILPLYTDSIIFNSLLSSTFVLLTSVILSGFLIFIWTSARMSVGLKFSSIGGLALVILLATAYINFF